MLIARYVFLSIERIHRSLFYFIFPRSKLLSDNLRETMAYHGIHLAPIYAT